MRDLKIKLIKGESVEITGNDNHILLFRSKMSQVFICQLNAKTMFGFKSWDTFSKKLLELTKKHGISI